jgi:hypothetical protein
MKRGNGKTISREATTRQPLLKRTKAAREKAGAPPAFSLRALQIGNFLEHTIEETRLKRLFLAPESTDDITKRVWLELWELADRVLNPGMRRKGLENTAKEILEGMADSTNAAEKLSAMAVTAAELLEELADSNAKYEIILAAARNHKRPVNLSLGVRRKTATLQSAEDAKKYLIKIKLGKSPRGPLQSLTDPKATPFTKAAELILHDLLRWRERGAWANLTSWNKDLLFLHYPMTKNNVNDWWAVAKCWLDEQWETKPELFTPLKKACKHEKSRKGKDGKKIIEEKEVSLDRSDVGLFESQIKSHVIDLRLKEAFFALAKPADL